MLDTDNFCDDIIEAAFEYDYTGNCHKLAKHISFVFESNKIKVEKIIITGYWLDRYPV